jgi:PHD/YefM family antitoxin component YafN of YafNO toxin-antitoxin module
MRVSATEAKNRFGSLSAQAKREPVFVEKAGQLDTVILSAELYHALQANLDKANRAGRKKRFEAEFRDWIAEENARVEANGVPGADLRPW